MGSGEGGAGTLLAVHRQWEHLLCGRTLEELCLTTIAASTVKDCDPNTGEPDSDEG